MIFSIEASTICALGSVCVRSPLPSFVTMIEVPVSATRKFAPVMPTSASRKRSRRMPRASPSSVSGAVRSRSFGSLSCTRRKSASTWSRLTWIAGAMMWLGCSPRSWMMYSPRSVSTGSMPFCSRWSFRPISSEIIVLPLVTVLASRSRQIFEDDVARLGGVGRPVHVAARRRHLRLEALEIEVEMGQRVVLDVARPVAQRVELGQLLARRGALGDEARRHVAERPLQVPVRQGVRDVRLEARGGDLDHLTPPLRRSPARRSCRRAPRRRGAPGCGCPRASACRRCS